MVSNKEIPTDGSVQLTYLLNLNKSSELDDSEKPILESELDSLNPPLLELSEKF
jgi:hypothetical protein